MQKCILINDYYSTTPRPTAELPFTPTSGSTSAGASLSNQDGNLLIDPSNGQLIRDPNPAIIGNPNPDFTVGITNTFSFKGIRLSAVFDWKEGGDLYSNTVLSMLGRGVTKFNEDREMMKKMKIKYFISILLSLVLVLFSSCEDFLDINDDPNNPTEVPISQLLSTVEVDMAGSMGASVGGLSGYTSAMVHQMFQRGNTHQFYDLQGTDFEVQTPWNIMYSRLLTDIRQIISLATEDEGNEDWHYVGIVQIIKAYAFSFLVDIWADVPFINLIKIYS
ncbi:hypothetical protein ES708_21603 [subsurface metagenome]